MELVSMRITVCSHLGAIIIEIGAERLLISVVVRNLNFPALCCLFSILFSRISV